MVKKVLFRVFALLVGIGFALIFIELFLRINPRFGYNYNSFRFKQPGLHLDMQCYNNLRPSALLGYEYTPNCNNGFPKTNSYGLIGPEYGLKKDKDTFRILVLGDSIAAQGWSCEFLEEELNRNPPYNKKYKKFEVWNSGVASYDVQRYALYLKYKGIKYNPDMVIIFFCMNDFYIYVNVLYKDKKGAVEYYFSTEELFKRGIIVSPFFLRHSYLYRFLALKLNSYLLSLKKMQGINYHDEENGRYYLQMIKEICERNKISLLVVIFPYLKPLDKYRIGEIDQYQNINKVTKELKLNYINLYEHLPEKDLYSLRNFKQDEVHPSREGHRLIAKIIYGYLLNRYFKTEK